MLYTVGYSNWTPPTLCAAVTRLGAILADIRYQPASRWQPRWNRRALAAALGTQYVHLKALGNVNYKQRIPVELLDYATGKAAVEALLAAGQPVILMCMCRGLDTCHRLVVAELLRVDLGLEATELLPSGQTGGGGW
jgi:uncharacterized protein (DUF488 family)